MVGQGNETRDRQLRGCDCLPPRGPLIIFVIFSLNFYQARAARTLSKRKRSAREYNCIRQGETADSFSCKEKKSKEREKGV